MSHLKLVSSKPAPGSVVSIKSHQQVVVADTTCGSQGPAMRLIDRDPRAIAERGVDGPGDGDWIGGPRAA